IVKVFGSPALAAVRVAAPVVEAGPTSENLQKGGLDMLTSSSSGFDPLRSGEFSAPSRIASPVSALHHFSVHRCRKAAAYRWFMGYSHAGTALPWGQDCDHFPRGPQAVRGRLSYRAHRPRPAPASPPRSSC